MNSDFLIYLNLTQRRIAMIARIGLDLVVPFSSSIVSIVAPEFIQIMRLELQRIDILASVFAR